MLRHYIDVEQITIPYTHRRYTITLKGEVRDVVEKRIVPELSGAQIELVLFDKLTVVSKAWLIAVSFKPLFRASSFALNWKVLFVDGNEDNVHPFNLIWQPPEGGQPCPENNNFYVIPGFSRNAISRDGVGYARLSKRPSKARPTPTKIPGNFYMNINAVTDRGHSTILGVHRAMGLAFLPYDNAVNSNTVNHRNGIKNDNVLLNLEWATYSENNIHAKDTLLCNVRQAVVIKNLRTGEVIQFQSANEAAAYVGIESGEMHVVLHKRLTPHFKFKYSIQLKSEFKGWPLITKQELIDLETAYKERISGLKCMARNISTGAMFLADSPVAMANLLGLHKEQVRTALNSDSLWPCLGYEFDFLKNSDRRAARRVYDAKELEYFKDKTGVRQPYKVYSIHDRNNVTIYVNLRQAAQAAGANEKFLWHFFNNGNYDSEHNGFNIEKMEYYSTVAE